MITDQSKTILRLAGPAIAENILHALVGFIDSLMIARISLIAVTAVGLANNLLAVYLALFLAVSIAASALVSQALGANDPVRASQRAFQAMVLATILGGLLSLAGLVLGSSLLRLIGAQGDVLKDSRLFFQLVAGGSIFHAWLTVAGSIIRAGGDTKSPLKINLIVNLINLSLNYILIFGVGPMPAFGVLGAAIATVAARFGGSLLMIRQLQRSACPIGRPDLTRGGFSRLLRLALPAALERLVMRLGQVVYFSLIVTIGVTTYAAHSIAGSIESFAYMPGYGLATAATILVGRAVGQSDWERARQVGWQTVKLGCVIMGLAGLGLYLFAPWLAGIFTGEAEAIKKIVIALRIDAFAMIPLAISLILTGALQGSGDMKTPLLSTLIGMWLVRVSGIYLLGLYFGLDIAGIWLAILLDLVIRAAVLSYRFARITRPETDSPPAAGSSA